MYSSTPNYHDTVGTVLKVLAGLGILIITIAMIFYFIDLLSFTNAWFVYAMTSGAVILVMAWLSIRIFERM